MTGNEGRIADGLVVLISLLFFTAAQLGRVSWMAFAVALSYVWLCAVSIYELGIEEHWMSWWSWTLNLDKCFWFPYLLLVLFLIPILDPIPMFCLPSCLASVLGISLPQQGCSLDATWAVYMCMAWGDTEAWAAGTGCSTSVLLQNDSRLLGRCVMPVMALYLHVCMFFSARASSGKST